MWLAIAEPTEANNQVRPIAWLSLLDNSAYGIAPHAPHCACRLGSWLQAWVLSAGRQQSLCWQQSLAGLPSPVLFTCSSLL